MTKEQLPELAPAGTHGNNPSTSSPFSFNPHQSFPKMHPTPLTPWLPFLLRCWPQRLTEENLNLFNNNAMNTHTFGDEHTLFSFVAALIMTPL